MRLDFNVLWVDDQPAAVASLIEGFRAYTEREGFRLNVQPARSLEEAAPFIRDNVFVDELDLILVDYDLGYEQPHGDAVLALFRQHAAYKEVVFYSAVAPKELKLKVFEADVEGVYCTARMDLVETAERVFEALVKKVLDLDHSRGIVLGATSDIDHVVVQALEAMHEALTDLQRADVMATAVTTIKGTIERTQTALAKIEAAGTMTVLLDHHQFFTSVDKLKLLLKLYDHRYPNSERALRKTIGRYLNAIPGVRNELAHVRIVAEGSQRELRGSGGKTFSAARLKEVRCELLGYRDEFEALGRMLGLQLV